MSDTPDWTGILESFTGLPYDGEAVDQLAHSLQCAHLAASDGGDDVLVAACALHDVGRAPAVRQPHRGMPHEDAGEAFCRQHLGDDVAYLVQRHVDAKRYLVTVEPGYAAVLSPVSVASLKRQGGPMTPAEVADFESDPRHPDAVRLRRFDDAAKTPGATQLSVDEAVRVIERVARASDR